MPFVVSIALVSASTFHYGSIKIKAQQILDILEELSTFHYGSIKIANLKIAIEEIKESTFHYGSIKMWWKMTKLLMIYYLHSTMVLLKWRNLAKLRLDGL